MLGGRYTLASRVASGGMADVWAAKDEVLRRDVAVKVMRPDAEHEEIFAARFRDEAVNSASLLHANIATVFDYGEEDHLAYLVMELVRARRSRRCSASAPPSPTPRCAPSWARRPSRSASPTRPASCIEMSSPRTSCCARTAS